MGIPMVVAFHAEQSLEEPRKQEGPTGWRRRGPVAFNPNAIRR
jgi:hypothetical protein